MIRPPLSHVLGRALRLLCPRCGQGWLFERWLVMHMRCSHCHLQFEREPGYFIGAMYVNYGLTIAVIVAGHFTLDAFVRLPLMFHVVLWSLVAIALPLALFRHARSLWLAMDFFVDPGEERPWIRPVE